MVKRNLILTAGTAGRDFTAFHNGHTKTATRRCLAHTLLVLLVLFTGLQNASAQPEQGTLWRQAVRTDLDVDFGGTGFHARWQFHRCNCGDLHVRVEQIAPDEILRGELLLVGGQVLLSRGFRGQGADIEPLIQAPSLMLQLANAILNRSQPEGPYAVNEKQAWNVSEKDADFKLDTGLATGIFVAPWEVKGSGWKTSSGSRRFELLFQFTNPQPGNPGAKDSMTFSGDLDFSQQDFPYPETTDLEGWRIQWISQNDPESKPVPAGLKLKELRQQVKDQ